MLPTGMLAIRDPANRRTDFKAPRETGQSSGLKEDRNVMIVRDNIPKGKERVGRPKKRWTDTFYSRNRLPA
jgi:hypothetical protein